MLRPQQKEKKDGKKLTVMGDTENPLSSTYYRWQEQRKWNKDKDN